MVGRWMAGILVATAVAGCLFPSFDDVRKKSSDDTNTSTSSSSSSGSSTSSSSSSSSSTSSGSTATNLVNSTLQCDDDLCTPPSEFCCNTDKVFDIGTDCTPTGSEKSCVNQDGSQALVMRCDGNEDCATGFSCCFTDKVGSSCQPRCVDGSQMCNKSGAACPTGTCSGPAKGGVKTCQ